MLDHLSFAREIGITLAHVVVVINNRKAQPLKFLLEGQLNKIMGSAVSSPSILYNPEKLL